MLRLSIRKAYRLAASICACWIWMVAVEQTRLFSQEPSAQPTLKQPPKNVPPELVPLQHNYDEAVEKSQKLDRPILVILGAEWCGPCKQLEKELELPQAEPVFRKWIVVKIDIDEEVALAKEWQVSSVPAFRVLDMDQDVVASNEGFGGWKKFQEWLDENFDMANPQSQRILRDEQPVDAKTVNELIAMLRDRRPNTRKRVMERLTKSRDVSVRPLAEVLATGNLLQRICALEILEKWSAPVAGMDPWEPDTIDDERLASLNEWLNRDTEK